MKNQSTEQPKRHVKGIWIPLYLWEHPDLSLLEKVLLAEIDSLDGGKGCWASNEYLASFLKASANHINNSLTKLRKMGLIKTVNFDGRKRYLKTKLAYLKKGRQTTEKKYVDNIGDKERSQKTSLRHSKTSCSRQGDSLHPKIKTPFSRKMAERMLRFLKAKNLLRRKVDLPSWQRAFTQLRIDGQLSKRTIREVFDWWKDNVIHNKYCPKTYSAISFCREFIRIEQAMVRDLENPDDRSPIVEDEEIVGYEECD